MSEIFNLNVGEISSLIQNKELKAESVLSSYLENIKKHNGDINAIVSQVPSNQLLEQAYMEGMELKREVKQDVNPERLAAVAAMRGRGPKKHRRRL